MSIEYTKAKPYPGKDLTGFWSIYYKIDGIRSVGSIEGQYVSRAGKPLPGLNKNATEAARLALDIYKDCEIFYKDWNTSNSLCMNATSDTLITRSNIYALNPPDSRLHILDTTNPTVDEITSIFDEAIAKGYEGIILRGKVKGKMVWYKLKPEETVDVRVLGVVEGKGKRKGCVGKFITAYGNVGIFKGITEPELREMWNQRDAYLGSIIEVVYMEKTINGKMRSARFIRPRFDKDTESYL